MRTVFVGDVHGCLDELRLLCDKLALSKTQDTLVFLGDLLDRGPDPVGVVRFVRLEAVELVYALHGIKGNHEEKALRWLRHEAKVALGKQAKNPMKEVDPGRQAEWKALDDADRAFLEIQPLTMKFDVAGELWVAVHGGLLPGRSVESQVERHASEIIRCRWVSPEGKHVGMIDGSREQPPGSFTWMERFDGEFNVVVGHAIHDKVSFQPRVDKMISGFEAWSIDTGCYGGGRLSALVLDHDRPGHREVVQVQAAREYCPFNGDGS